MSQRTTVTLDEDVSTLLEREAQKKGLPPDALVNATLRKVLDSQEPADAFAPFVVRGPFLRARPGIDFGKVERLLDDVEGL